MQNKGFVGFIAGALFLACAFYLSFSFVTSHYETEAEKVAAGDPAKYYAYMDSLSAETVWMGHTLKECREKELNLGLDLKGGMNVILEISVPDIVRALANQNSSENFNKAMNLAIERQANSQSDFLTLFEEAYNEVDANGKLAAIFSTFELKDKISLSSTNEEVMEVLRAEVESAVSNSFNVLRTRIDRFGVVQPNIQRLENSGRILVELPGIKEPERVRKLLQGTANLEFWETYDASEVVNFLAQADAVLAEANVDATESKADTLAVVEPKPVTDSLSADAILGEIAKEDNSNKEPENVTNEQALVTNPLLARLQINQQGGPVVGYAHYKDTTAIREMLESKAVKSILPSDLQLKWGVKAFDQKETFFELYAIKCNNREGKAPLEGDAVTSASQTYGEHSAYAAVSMTMSPDGANVWARLTEENVGRSIAIVLDGYVYSAPRVNGKITGGRSEITGNFTVEEAKDLANVLGSGKMPASVKIVQEDVVGPSLGQEAITSGFWSFLLAFVLILVYMVFFYGLVPGLIADFALIINVFLLMGILASFKAVLTLPGITGIVLTLGMAIDTNVLIFDRIREELRAGKLMNKAIKEGYSNAASAIIDANITTILTGVVLFMFGTGPIKGFATTLIIGIITSLITGFLLTRLVYDYLIKKDKVKNMKFCTNVTESWFQNLNFNFVGNRKWGYIISGVLIAISVISLCVRGLNQGIDFSGGRNYVITFNKSVSTEEVKSLLAPAFDGQSPSVITIKSNELDNSDARVRVSTNFKIESNDPSVDEEIEGRLYAGLKTLLPEGVTQEEFVNNNILSSQKVGPTVADDIKRDATFAIVFAVLIIGLYILVRFRNIAFSVGSIVGLIHDTLIIFGCYSLFYSIMPFSLEIDQAFIAAILTIVGYSINDTVVVFDRVREYRTLYPTRDQHSLLNSALNSTLGRTFNTSFTTSLVLIAIFLFGGESIRGFVFALLIGVVVGTYSTLFVAVPVAYEILMKKVKKAVK